VFPIASRKHRRTNFSGKFSSIYSIYLTSPWFSEKMNYVQTERKCSAKSHLNTARSKPFCAAICVLRVSGGLKVSVKKTRAPADLEENLDDRNVQAAEPSTVPPGFLSPSVKEYLELGKSIPGR
jgi:hypothetical protein